MENTIEKKYYAELYSILNYLGQDYIDKIPSELYRVIDTVREKDYNISIDSSKPLYEQKFMPETINFLAGINLLYWEKDPKKKEMLTKQYKENDVKKQKELEEKYSYENLFKKQGNEEENNKQEDNITQEDNMALQTVKKQSIFVRIINKIKLLFGRKNK